MTPQELKNSILQFAIQGKLVEQRPEEGTAEELFAQIQEEKQRLIAEKKIKKEKPLPEITEDEKPFEIPASWKWVRVQEIACLNPKNELSDELEVSFVPMALVDDGYRNSHSFETKKWGDIKKGFTHFVDGDIGIAKITPCFQNRKSVVFRNLKNGYGAGTTELSIVRVINNLVSRDFLLWFFKSAYFIENGVKSFTGTAGQQRIHKDYLSMCCFPLPPLAEQKRIVAKIEELLPYIERYEQAWSKLEQFNSRFPDDMKKSLLQYAIQGKLVEQRPEEGTAEELFAQIQEEKQRLIQEGKLKKTKALPSITDEEIPADFPSTWKVCYIDDIAFVTKLAGFEYTKNIAPNLTVTGIPLFKGKNVQNGKLVLNFDSYIPEQVSDELSRSQISKKCLLTPYVGTIGNIAIFDGGFKAHLGSNVGKIELLNGEKNFIIEEFVLYYLRSQIGYQQLTKYKKATAQESISIDAIRNVIIAFPPLAEQKRIVKKLEQLLPLCERLK